MKIYLTLALIFLSAIAYSQDESSRNQFYARIGLSEPSIGYERRIGTNFGLGFEAGYRFRFTKKAYVPYGIITYPFQAFWMAKAYRGISLRPVILNFYNLDENVFSITTSYQFLTADNIIYDPGKLGGSNTSDYAEYSDQRHQIGLAYLFNRPFNGLPALSWFAELGAKLVLYERRYSIEGTFTGQMPSNKVLTGKDFGIILNVGLKLNVFKF